MFKKFPDYIEKYKPETVLFQEGDVGNDFYIIGKGLINIIKEIDGEEVVVATVGPGEVLGEMALVEEGAKRSAAAKAHSEVACLKFDQKQFDQLLEKSQEFRQRILQVLCQRLRGTTKKLTEAQHKADLIENASSLLLYFVLDNNLQAVNKKEFKFDHKIDRVANIFGLKEEEIEALLVTASSDRLTRFAPEKEKIASAVAEKILMQLLDKLSLILPEEFEPEDLEKDKTELDVTEAAENVKKLYLTLSNTTTDITFDQYTKLKKSCQQFEKLYDRGKTSARGNKSEQGQLGAYTRGLKRDLGTKIRSQIKEFKEKNIEERCRYLYLYDHEITHQQESEEKRALLILPIGIKNNGYPALLGYGLIKPGKKSELQKLTSSLRSRGLKGVEMVIANRLAGIDAAASKTFDAGWNWCRDDFIDTILQEIPENQHHNARDQLREIFRQTSDKEREAEAESIEQWFRKKDWDKAADLVAKNYGAAINFSEMPKTHWKKLQGFEYIDEVAGKIISELRLDEEIDSFENLNIRIGLLLNELLEKNDGELIGRPIFDELYPEQEE